MKGESEEGKVVTRKGEGVWRVFMCVRNALLLLLYSFPFCHPLTDNLRINVISPCKMDVNDLSGPTS